MLPSRPPPGLTPRQWDVLRTALDCRTDEVLSASALAETLGLARQNLREHLLALAAAGWLEYHARPRQPALLILTPRARALRARQGAHSVPLPGFPVLGEVAAGPPGVAEQHVEGMVTRLDEVLTLHEGDFLLRVRGQSMTGLGIFPGDLVVIRPAEVAHNGDLALVLVPGEDTATLKRWQRRGRTVTLLSENPAFEPMRYAADDVQVQGLLIGHVGSVDARRRP
ncbi:repressor LexA [Deinococcus metalli]|uniref:LexA repressor n=2 Tax=Deinococcus metalli TaxID=1141878 RepID=A0A7W8NST1_9DEIO|nr:LexA family transcriptional regulator [Deinococcus metalli]MBB5378318.1 repressor LexA [Deinococcus metalli]GHF59750.1 lexA repressor [Deinococcus metalli]